MVTEQFLGGADAVRERFERSGRMLPDGLTYLASWITPDTLRCFQLMEADRIELLEEWTRRWDDLVAFEIAPVVEASAFWRDRSRPSQG